MVSPPIANLPNVSRQFGETLKKQLKLNKSELNNTKKKLIYFYSNLTGKSNRIEYGIYLFFEIIAVIYVLHLNKNMSFENETVYNLFYTWIILNFIFVPINAVSTRRLRDIGLNCGLIFLNFIPIVNIFFRVFLLTKKGKELINLKEL